MRWLLLDEVIAIKKGVKALTRSRVPRGPVTPELLMMEMMAQTGGLLLGAESDYKNDLIFAKIEEATFLKNAPAGEVIHIEAVSENLRPEGAWLDACIRCGEDVLAKGRFLLMNVGRLVSGVEKAITFHDAFMDYFQVRKKVQCVPVEGP